MSNNVVSQIHKACWYAVGMLYSAEYFVETEESQATVNKSIAGILAITHHVPFTIEWRLWEQDFRNRNAKTML